MRTKKVAIIIVNWNGKRLLKNCLDAVFKQTYKNFDVYFVDNGSVDNSVKFVKHNFPKTKIIQLNKNYGFAKGNNEGIKEAFKDKNIEYIVCLNNDTIVNKNWLKELIKTAEKDEKIGMVSSKAYFLDGKIQNAGLSLENALQINRLGSLSIGYGLEDNNPKLKKDIEIFAAYGAAPLYKREMLEELYNQDGEFFDEDFFSCAEDSDLCFRARLLGWNCYLSANAKLKHLHSQTEGLASPFKAYYSERNNNLMAIKNLPFWRLIRFFLENIKLKFSYVTKKNKSVQKLKGNIGIMKMLWILIKAHLVFFILIPKFLIKRWKIQSEKKVSNKEINSWFKKYSREMIENE